MSIRPVSRCLPTSQALWDDTNLPMCVVLTPCEDDDEGEEDTEAQEATALAAGNTVGVASSSSAFAFAQPISAIPKCLHCGAPHPTSTTHFRPQFSSLLLCYLCGKSSSTFLSDQQDARIEEYLDPDLFDKLSIYAMKRNYKNRNTKTNNNVDDDDVCADVDSMEFRVPVEVCAKRKQKNLVVGAPDVPSLTWQLPAMACPPVWWIVVDGTVNASSTTSPQAARNYWQTVGNLLDKVLDDIPSHVHVGLVTATASRLACWDFVATGTASSSASVVPHVKHYPYSYTPSSEKDGFTPLQSDKATTAWDLCLVPANELYKPSIRAAIRAMVDGAESELFSDKQLDTTASKEDATANDTSNLSSMGFPLGLTLEILLEFMELARHPGQDFSGMTDHENADEDSDDTEDEEVHLRYAGGKILCLLGNPPMEIVPASNICMAQVSQPPFFQGGVAGSCFQQDNKDRWGIANDSRNDKKYDKKDSTDDTDPTDVTPGNLKNYVIPLDPEDLFATIGKRCANSALGVDLFVLVAEEDDDDKKVTYSDHETTQSSFSKIPWYGLALLRVLSDYSGAPGPLMFGTSHYNSDGNVKTPSSHFRTLLENILSRTPWQAGMVFGAQLRLRISPGFELEATPVEKERKTKLQLAPLLSSGGLMGPAYADESGSDSDAGLWIMGTCDPYTSFTIDFQAAKHVPSTYHVDGFGDVALRPVIQTCLIYTCIETDGSQTNPSFFTVCKMKVNSLSLPLTDDVEEIYDALDPEALAAVLYHKISLDAYLAGLTAAQNTAESWLRSLLVCVYQSAQVEQAKLEEEKESKHHLQGISTLDTKFVASERLLDQEGDLSFEDVLLGQGHVKIALVPLLVFALMQCDALRPSGGNFQPSIDARVCAMTQMASMTPSALAKIIAPSLMLFSAQEDEIVLESLPLSHNDILNVVEGLGCEEDYLLLMDSPRRVILYLAHWLNGEGTVSQNGDTIIPKVGSLLESTVMACLKGCRSAPFKWDEVEAFLDGGNVRIASSTEFRSMLLEDKPLASGISNFADWKIQIAASVQEELEKSGDI